MWISHGSITEGLNGLYEVMSGISSSSSFHLFVPSSLGSLLFGSLPMSPSLPPNLSPAKIPSHLRSPLRQPLLVRPSTAIPIFGVMDHSPP